MSWLAPVGSPRGTPFGAAGHLWASGYHTGQDFLAPSGTPVHACAGGRVVYAGDTHGSYGIQVKVRHKVGLETWYCHLSALSVKTGDVVAAGALLGRSGATGNVTGPHLHLEFRVNGVAVDPVPYLDGKKGNPPNDTSGSGIAPAVGWDGSTKVARGSSSSTTATTVADTTDTADEADSSQVRDLALTTLIVVGGFGLVAVGAFYAARPAIKKAASLTPEGALLDAASKGLPA